MQGNRATQTSGLARALCYSSLRGVDGRDGFLLLSQLFTCLFPSMPPRRPCTSLSKVFLSLTAVSQPPPRNWVPPSCLRSSAQFVCCLSLCKCVLALFPLAHTPRNPPLICNLLPHTLSKHLIRLSVGLLVSGTEWTILSSSCDISRGKHLRRANVDSFA